jgi:hypothetical protein
LGPLFYLIYNTLVWTSAAIIVGGCYLIWEILKLFIKLLEKLFGKITENLENKSVNRYNSGKLRENRRIT